MKTKLQKMAVKSARTYWLFLSDYTTSEANKIMVKEAEGVLVACLALMGAKEFKRALEAENITVPLIRSFDFS